MTGASKQPRPLDWALSHDHEQTVSSRENPKLYSLPGRRRSESTYEHKSVNSVLAGVMGDNRQLVVFRLVTNPSMTQGDRNRGRVTSPGCVIYIKFSFAVGEHSMVLCHPPCQLVSCGSMHGIQRRD